MAPPNPPKQIDEQAAGFVLHLGPCCEDRASRRGWFQRDTRDSDSQRSRVNTISFAASQVASRRTNWRIASAGSCCTLRRRARKRRARGRPDPVRVTATPRAVCIDFRRAPPVESRTVRPTRLPFDPVDQSLICLQRLAVGCLTPESLHARRRRSRIFHKRRLPCILDDDPRRRSWLCLAWLRSGPVKFGVSLKRLECLADAAELFGMVLGFEYADEVRVGFAHFARRNPRLHSENLERARRPARDILGQVRAHVSTCSL